ncbi:MAG TPA: TRC40/GET3/ArsA family transport-energizing ATPase [Dehalococcoidia bacterium]|nr:TRC40/GET3/ArsA family transport-energizing ATPase [Dehalococcoidia bacterium]
MRIILYTGKGGVGKTSVAAATALRCAELGHRTLVMSTDIAHSLGDVFAVPLGPEPVAVAGNLWGQEVDVEEEVDAYWGTIQQWLRTLLSWRGVDTILAEDMALLPGMEDLAGLLQVLRYHDKGSFDVIIVDCAPTGETIRLLAFPDAIRWWMHRIFPVERAAARVLRPFLSRLTDLPLPEDQVFAAVERLYERLDEMHGILADGERSSVRLVLNAERIVLKETQRAFAALALYGYSVDLVVCNRLWPPEVKGEYFAAWQGAQEQHFQEIGAAFSPLPVLTAPLLEREVVGLPMLERLAEALYDSQDPSPVFYHGSPQTITREDNAYILTLALPFTQKGEVGLSRSGDELVVQVGSLRRNVILPRSLAGLEGREARLEEGKLRIRFMKASQV